MTGKCIFGVAAALLGTLAVSAHADETVGEVRFGFDSSELPADATSQLDQAMTFATLHPESRIVLHAYCDPTGTAAYNIGLASRRAESVRDQLVALGVPRDQIVFAIFGEDGQQRATHAAARRVSLTVTGEPASNIVERTFADGGTAVIWGQPLTTAQIDAYPQPVARR